MNISNLIQNKKQKTLWVLYIVLLFDRMFNLPSPDSSSCLAAHKTLECSYVALVYWKTNFGGYLIYFVFMTTVFIVVASLLKDKKGVQNGINGL